MANDNENEFFPTLADTHEGPIDTAAICELRRLARFYGDHGLVERCGCALNGNTEDLAFVRAEIAAGDWL